MLMRPNLSPRAALRFTLAASALRLAGGLAGEARTGGPPAAFARQPPSPFAQQQLSGLTPALTALAARDDPADQAAAAAALGKVAPPPEDAVPVLQRLLGAKDAGV